MILLLFVAPWIGERIGVDLDVIRWVLAWPVEQLLDLIIAITGIPDLFS